MSLFGGKKKKISMPAKIQKFENILLEIKKNKYLYIYIYIDINRYINKVIITELILCELIV